MVRSRSHQPLLDRDSTGKLARMHDLVLPLLYVTQGPIGGYIGLSSVPSRAGRPLGECMLNNLGMRSFLRDPQETVLDQEPTVALFLT